MNDRGFCIPVDPRELVSHGWKFAPEVGRRENRQRGPLLGLRRDCSLPSEHYSSIAPRNRALVSLMTHLGSLSWVPPGPGSGSKFWEALDRAISESGKNRGQQLLPKGEVLQEEFFSGAKDGDDPAEQISKTHKHQGIVAKSAPRRCACKSLILRTRRVLARDRSVTPRGVFCISCCGPC